jgi:hypothetical protein
MCLRLSNYIAQQEFGLHQRKIINKPRFMRDHLLLLISRIQSIDNESRRAQRFEINLYDMNMLSIGGIYGESNDLIAPNAGHHLAAGIVS